MRGAREGTPAAPVRDEPRASEAPATRLSRAAKRELLRLAREELHRATGRGAGAPSAARSTASEDPALSAPAAAFVSLHDRRGAVRGCVGTTQGARPLCEVVKEMSRAAALRDPRFSPVAAEEAAELDLEISVLEPPVRVRALEEVELGRDGLMVVGRGARGLLLPQVAIERGWDVETFAEHTAQKAGLPPRAYLAEDVELFRFAAEVFSERELELPRGSVEP